jgi:hypothetical protein
MQNPDGTFQMVRKSYRGQLEEADSKVNKVKDRWEPAHMERTQDFQVKHLVLGASRGNVFS